VPQTVSFLRSIVADDEFRAATYDTGFVSRIVARQQLTMGSGADDDAVLAGV
jgi:hypothetical protein